MPDTSSNLSLPFILPSQAQKHVTHNEAILALDALVQLSVISRTLSEPPAAPAEGARYIVASGAQFEWAGQDGNVALQTDSGWLFLAPRPGWRAWDEETAEMAVFDGIDWMAQGSAVLNQVELFGLATDANPSTPFSARLNTAMWTGLPIGSGGTGDIISVQNRETDGNMAGTILQTNGVSQVTMGQFGSADFRIAISPDGMSFNDGLKIDRDTGRPDMPNLPRFKAHTNFDNYVVENVWAKIGINITEYNDQTVFDASTNLFTAPAAGTYMFGASGLFKKDVTVNARMRMQLVRNGTEVVKGSFGENSSPHADLLSALWIQTMVPLSQGDTVELQGTFRGENGYFAADHTTFWGCKVG